MSMLTYLAELHELKKFAQHEQQRLDLSQLEQNFLTFARCSSKHELVIQKPRLYTVKGEERQHYCDAVAALGKTVKAIPTGIDIAGRSIDIPLKNSILMLSPRQVLADTLSPLDSCLFPLLEEIYTSGTLLLRDYALHEAVSGKLVRKRGNLLLDETPLFPEKFTPGPYEISVTLETPSKTIAAMRSLQERFASLKNEPQKKMLSPLFISSLTTDALLLRQRLGSLSRYEIPATQTFTAAVNTCVIETPETTAMYLYQKERNCNTMVYFGKDPFQSSKSKPKDLSVFDGNDREHTLAALVGEGIFTPSQAVIEQRYMHYQSMHEAMRRSKTGASASFTTLLERLHQAHEYFSNVLNPELRKNYVFQQPSELMELMVCPALAEDLVSELLPKLSWNQHVRRYHDAEQFKQAFIAASEHEKLALVQQTVSSLVANNYQNPDVNAWLAAYHRPLCETVGVSFRDATPEQGRKKEAIHGTRKP